MLPAEINEKVLEMIRNMRNTAVVIKFYTAVGLATDIFLANDRTLLKKNGVTVEFTVGWCQSIFKRLNFVRRKSATAKPMITPGLIKEIGFSFYKDIHELVKWFNIPKELVINIDQTPLPFVLVSSYIMERKENQFVPIAKTTAYHQITGTLWCLIEGGWVGVGGWNSRRWGGGGAEKLTKPN